MKPRFVSSALLALIWAGAIAEPPNLNKYSDAEIWGSADLIALVKIKSSTYFKYIGFDMKAIPLVVLKGDSDESIGISADYPLPDAPSQLGSSYLVFLTESGAGHYNLISEIRSVVPIIYVDLDDNVAVRNNVLKISDDRDWYSYDGSLWIVDCGRLTAAPDSEHCMLERSVVEYTMNRVGGVKGD